MKLVVMLIDGGCIALLAYSHPEYFINVLTSVKSLVNILTLLIWVFFLNYYLFCCLVLHLGTLVPQPGLNPGPRQWQLRVLTMDHQGIH